MIRKTLLWGLIVLALVVAGAPALVGLYLEREFDTLVARLERPGVTQVTTSRFERGWFSSLAHIRVALDTPLCDGPPCAGVMLDTTIHHGPLALGAPVDPDTGMRPSLGVAVTRVEPASLWPRLVFDPALTPLRIVTRVGFNARARSQLTIDRHSVDISRARLLAHIENAPATVQAALSLGAGPSSAQIDAPQFQLIGENGGQLAWQNLRARFGPIDTPGQVANQSTGAALQVDSLRMADGLGLATLLEALDLQWQALPSETPGVSGRLDARIARAVINNTAYGPLRLNAQGAGIDPVAWRALIAQLGALRDPASGEIDPEARATLYRETIPAVLADRPQLDIQTLDLTTPEGDVRIKLRVEAPEQPREARLLADVVSQLDLDFDARVPAGIVRDITVQVMLASGRSPYAIEESDIDAALAELVAERLIESVDDGAAYRLHLSIVAGRLTLNGHNQIGWQAMVDQFEAARERL